MALILAALQPGVAAGAVVTRRTAGLPPPLSAVDLQLSLELGPLVAPDYTFTRVYATVTNLGPARAENATVAFAFPPPLFGRPADGMPACEGTDSGTLVCPVPGLDVGATAVVEVELSLPPAEFGAFSLRATASGGGVETTPGDNQEELSTKGPGSLQLRGGCSTTAGRGADLVSWAVLIGLLGARGRRGRASGAR
ncbi:hypothetical protein NR798_18275 [Archangium gephyra]|uniref:hypothetical protein n=1 Tax=Archangium gephyra TaxID=48 RepID=UPI0035D43E31